MSGRDGQLDEIRRAEYSSRAEILLRVLLVAFGTIALFALTRDPMVLSWFLAHVLFEALARNLLAGRLQLDARVRMRAFLASYVLASLVFVSLPLYFVTLDLSVGATTAALATLAGHLVYALHRRHHIPVIVRVDSLTFAFEGIVLFLSLHSRSQSLAETAAIAVALVGVTLYAVVALNVGRHRQKQLREAQQRYAEAQKARALNQFVGGVAHDFNNQLTAIMGNLELLEVLDAPDDRAEAMRHSREAAKHAARTVRQLLASSGRQRLDPVAIEITPFVTDLRDLLTDMLDPEVAITTDVAPGLMARADRDMLETCIVQLCLNAQDAMAGRGQITIRAHRTAKPPAHGPRPEAPPPWIALGISDNGPGADPTALDRLAEPFFTSKPPSEGRGLGLSAVAGFAKQSGGSLALEQPRGSGLSATILLPEARPQGPLQPSGAW